VVLLAGCQVTTAKSEPVEADWSRGLNVGRATANSRPGMAVTAGGEVFLAWAGQTQDEGAPTPRNTLHLARLDASGRLVGQRLLDLQVGAPTDVNLLAHDTNTLLLVWLERSRGEIGLWLAILDPEGAVKAGPLALAPLEARVDSYAIGSGPDGRVDLIWSAQDGPLSGLYHRQLGGDGQVLLADQALADQGYDPAFRYDRQGRIHLAWLQRPDYGERQLFYAMLEPASRALTSQALIESMPTPLGLTLHPPAVGLAGEEVYVFWALERRGGGLSVPGAWSYMTSFPIGQPDARQARQEVIIPSSIHLRLRPAQSVFAIHALDPAYSGEMAPFTYMPSTSATHEDQLVVAFAVQMVGRTKSTIQIILSQWAEGALQGFQIAGQTRTGSLRPMLTADANRDLHLVWIDTAGFGAYDVYYASTREAVRAHLNRVTAADVLASALTLLWGVAQAMSFLPLAFVWVFVPILLLVAYVLFRAEGRLDNTAPRVVLVLAMVCYTLVKYFFQPGWLASLPLPAGLPEGLSMGLTLAMPVIISALAGYLTWLYIRRRKETASIFAAFAIFAVCDALITMLLYVPGILAE
jgi:hypothetical protein